MTTGWSLSVRSSGHRILARHSVMPDTAEKPPVIPAAFLYIELSAKADRCLRAASPCQPHEHFPFETPCVSNHVTRRFTERLGFSAYFWRVGAVPCRHVFCFFNGKTLMRSVVATGETPFQTAYA
ncbi:hypothetical protein [uncultured Desulfovibrio sp.]|uniref:hypothetical protein n=1 Tax=uncultured Desulfovibrio sp. TaxID=167968 RepID=UPI0026217FD9|nr:hypothetical protein [uncultured Desulfovibrio sp.]